MWFVEISTVKWHGKKLEYDKQEVEGFFVLQQDLEALYRQMDYLRDDREDELFGPAWFEERYGKLDSSKQTITEKSK